MIPETIKETNSSKKLKLFYTALFIMFALVAAFLYIRSSTQQMQFQQNPFRIVGETPIAPQGPFMLFIDGYLYQSLNESRDLSDATNVAVKRKLGRVDLDLTGLFYTDTPPDFSGTFSVGTKIYEINGWKKEYAVLAIDEKYDFRAVLYRMQKWHENDDSTPLNMTFNQVARLIAHSPSITSVELRTSRTGEYKDICKDDHFISLINSELSAKALPNKVALGNNYGSTLSFNLVFEKGEILPFAVSPLHRRAYVFGGYIELSRELTAEFLTFYNSQ